MVYWKSWVLKNFSWVSKSRWLKKGILESQLTKNKGNLIESEKLDLEALQIKSCPSLARSFNSTNGTGLFMLLHGAKN